MWYFYGTLFGWRAVLTAFFDIMCLLICLPSLSSTSHDKRPFNIPLWACSLKFNAFDLDVFWGIQPPMLASQLRTISCFSKISPSSQYVPMGSWELTKPQSWTLLSARSSSWPVPPSPRWRLSPQKKTFLWSNQLTCKPTASAKNMRRAIVTHGLLFAAGCERREGGKKNDNGTFWAPTTVVGVEPRRAHPSRLQQEGGGRRPSCWELRPKNIKEKLELPCFMSTIT